MLYVVGVDIATIKSSKHYQIKNQISQFHTTMIKMPGNRTTAKMHKGEKTDTKTLFL